MKIKLDRKPVIILLVIVIFFSGSFAVREGWRVYYFNTLAAYKSVIQQKIAQDRSTLSANNVSVISSWMTFDYINLIFALPTSYLQTELKINDTHYPHITLEKYAEKNYITGSLFITEVQDKVRLYFSSN